MLQQKTVIVDLGESLSPGLIKIGFYDCEKWFAFDVNLLEILVEMCQRQGFEEINNK